MIYNNFLCLTHVNYFARYNKKLTSHSSLNAFYCDFLFTFLPKRKIKNIDNQNISKPDVRKSVSDNDSDKSDVRQVVSDNDSVESE